MSGGCKASNVIIVFKDVKIGARRTRSLATCVNFLAHPRVKLRPSQHERGGGGSIRVESKLRKVIDMSISKDKAIAYTHKRCSI